MRIELNCPVNPGDKDRIVLAHGGGGRLTRRLIEQIFAAEWQNPHLDTNADSAVLEGLSGGRLAFTTDSYVVNPLFFPGGDIGCLAVNGTVNDLAMVGAKPQYLTASFIIEEGFLLSDLRRVVASMREACRKAGVYIVAGDTKVVDRGSGDGVFITTAGVGIIPPERHFGPAAIRPGDAVIVSGDIARHGMAVLSVREGLGFESAIESDCAPLNGLVEEVCRTATVHCLRDLTRGGLATALIELAGAAGMSMLIEEARIPVVKAVHSACELLGIDPLYVANEGRCVLFVPEEEAAAALTALHRLEIGREAAVIGRVTGAGAGVVELESIIGGTRVLDLLSGEQLPRIC